MTTRNAPEIVLGHQQCAIAHENGQKLTNRRVLMTARNAPEIVPGHQNSVLLPNKTARDDQIDEF